MFSYLCSFNEACTYVTLYLSQVLFVIKCLFEGYMDLQFVILSSLVLQRCVFPPSLWPHEHGGREKFWIFSSLMAETQMSVLASVSISFIISKHKHLFIYISLLFCELLSLSFSHS